MQTQGPVSVVHVISASPLLDANENWHIPGINFFKKHPPYQYFVLSHIFQHLNLFCSLPFNTISLWQKWSYFNFLGNSLNFLT